MVDLDGFEPSTSSMPFKKYQSLAQILTKNKRLKLTAIWTPLDASGRIFSCLDSARTRQPLLNPAREFLLPGQLNLGVLLSHPNRAVAGDFRRLDARPAYLLPP